VRREEKGSCMNEFGERLLSSLKGPYALLYLLSPCISISPHREIFSRANDLVLHFFLFLFLHCIQVVFHSFFVHSRKTRRTPRGRLSIAALIASHAKAHRYTRIGAVAKNACIFFVPQKNRENRESGQLE